MVRSSSICRPIKGSIRPSAASVERLVVYASSGSFRGEASSSSPPGAMAPSSPSSPPSGPPPPSSLEMPWEMKLRTSIRSTPSCRRKNTAWASGSRNIETSTSPPSMVFCSADRAWMVARWSTRSTAMVGWGSASSPSATCSTVSARYSSRFFCSLGMFTWHALRTSRVRASRVSDSSRCSSVRYSWRRRLASCVAWRKLSRSSFAISGDANSVVLRLHRQAQGELVLPRQLLRQAHLRLRYFIRINPGHADAVVMDVEHDLHGIRLGFVEDLFQHRHHEVAGSVVVVVQQYPVHRGPLQLFLRPGLGLGD